VPTVVSALWPVTEAVAGLFAERFYAELSADPDNKLHALTRAQRALRALTYEELAARLTPAQLRAGVLLSGRERPFSHMYFWAPFQLSGSPS
jgi:CHAT domain-containing protein